MNHIEVYRFWFEEIDSRMWWQKSQTFDTQVQLRFGRILDEASLGELWAWRATPQGRLAEIIVLDQFSRNIYRDQSKAFSQDAVALVLAQEAVARGALEKLSETERGFLLMPLMHSESKVIHAEAESLFKRHTSEQTYQFEVKHKRIIDRFGRYPHRNAILGRASTSEEQTFLQEPGSSF